MFKCYSECWPFARVHLRKEIFELLTELLKLFQRMTFQQSYTRKLFKAICDVPQSSQSFAILAMNRKVEYFSMVEIQITL